MSEKLKKTRIKKIVPKKRKVFFPKVLTNWFQIPVSLISKLKNIFYFNKLVFQFFLLNFFPAGNKRLRDAENEREAAATSKKRSKHLISKKVRKQVETMSKEVIFFIKLKY